MEEQNIFNTLYNTITSTSTYEGIKKISDVDYPELRSNVETARISKLGTPSLDSVQLILKKDLEGLGVIKDETNTDNIIRKGLANAKFTNGVNNKSFTLDDANVTINTTNNIVKTNITGRNGTFKELINQGDYIINLTGSLVGLIPFQDDIENLRKLQSIWDNIRVTNSYEPIVIISKFINSFDVYDVVITDFNLNLNKDYSNVIDYSINLESDSEIQIIV